jgi:hypothetical protein
MLKRAVEFIERFEEGDLKPSAFFGMTVLFTLGWLSYAACWALIGLAWYTSVRLILGYPI